jgi:hypothetical protein
MIETECIFNSWIIKLNTFGIKFVENLETILFTKLIAHKTTISNESGILISNEMG